MKKEKFDYRKQSTFINRRQELKFLEEYINEEPESILFLHGPRSSGKTILLYKFLEEIKKKQKLDVKFLNLREKLISNYKDFIRVFFGIDYSKSKDDVKEKREYSLFNFFKLSVEALKGVESGELDPFEVMKAEFIKFNQKGIKPVVIIDELQALSKVYIDNDKERELVIALFNFFVAMTKESHLAHIIIASSDGYFLNTVFNDSRLKKTSRFYKVDYLDKEEIMEWLLNLEKYSKIKDYTLNEEDAGKIWETVGGSMWEIQEILARLFDQPLDDVLMAYKKGMRGIIAHYTEFDKNKVQVLAVINKKETVSGTDFENLPIAGPELKELLRDMVKNNILYFDPTLAVYYPQGKSSLWGIRLYFEQ
ncbi:MAG TPA: ATP-binding protein [Candidatus Deferrimicrobium sp.]|nr:ATP-binding protein [Candidatus Deferrimicrobium sp.]